MEFYSKSPEQNKEIVGFVIKNLRPKTGAVVVGLYGELGAGKTTFMKYLAEALGVTETIQSPTFVIMKKYNLGQKIENKEFSTSETCSAAFQNLIHIDAYRIEKDEEILNLAWQEMLSDPKNLICIEWPERIKGLMPEHLKIYFEHTEKENERKIFIANEN